jgi:hypothetical protein
MSKIDYKYNEDEILREVAEYIDGTYSQHYAANQIEASEFIMDAGHGEGFFMGNILKYAQRYGKKGEKEDARKDLMKVIHYAVMAIYNHDVEWSASIVDEEGMQRLLEPVKDDGLQFAEEVIKKYYDRHPPRAKEKKEPAKTILANNELVYGKHRVNYDDDYPNY